jgi:hypothetical protein
VDCNILFSFRNIRNKFKNKEMKKILMGTAVLVAFALAITMVQISSCTKAVSQTPGKTDTVYVNTCPTDSVTGLWIGTYVGDGNSTPPQFYSLVLEPGGNVINGTQANADPNSQYLNIGTWQLSGDTLNLTYKNIYGVGDISYIGDIQNATAIFDKNAGTLTGIYTNVTITGSGEFTLHKVN